MMYADQPLRLWLGSRSTVSALAKLVTLVFAGTSMRRVQGGCAAQAAVRLNPQGLHEQPLKVWRMMYIQGRFLACLLKACPKTPGQTLALHNCSMQRAVHDRLS